MNLGRGTGTSKPAVRLLPVVLLLVGFAIVAFDRFVLAGTEVAAVLPVLREVATLGYALALVGAAWLVRWLLWLVLEW